MKNMNLLLSNDDIELLLKYKININENNMVSVNSADDLKNIQNGKVYKLNKNIALNGASINPRENTNFLIDLNGYTIFQESLDSNKRGQVILIENSNVKMLITDSSKGEKGTITSNINGYATIEVKLYAYYSFVVITGGITVESYNDFVINNNSPSLQEGVFILRNCKIISKSPYKAIYSTNNIGDVLLLAEEFHGALCSEDLKNIEYC